MLFFLFTVYTMKYQQLVNMQGKWPSYLFISLNYFAAVAIMLFHVDIVRRYHSSIPRGVEITLALIPYTLSGYFTKYCFFQSARSGPDCPRWIKLFYRPNCRPEWPQIVPFFYRVDRLINSSQSKTIGP